MNKLKILNYIAILSLVLVFSSYKEADKSQAELQAMMIVLQSHLEPLKVDDKLSERIFDLYLKRIDYSKKFLLKSDYEDLKKKYRDNIDDEIIHHSFEFFEECDRIVEQRIKDIEGIYKDELSRPFDFTANEKVETDAKKMDFPEGMKGLKDAWRKSLKEQVMVRLSDAIDAQEKGLEKKDTSVKVQTHEQMEVTARKKVLKTHDDWFKRMNKVEKTDRFSSFLNTIANCYDPHTDFFPPKEKEEFDIQMSGQFEGIGARLQQRDDIIKVEEIVPGSASYRQGQLKAGDIILKVAQGNEEPVDVTNMLLDKAVQLIRGKKGTEVRLTIKKPDASTVIIPIIRDKVVTEETFARSFILKDKRNIGYILLPGFYGDVNRNGARSCAEDVRKEVEKLKAKNVDGVIIDIRNNGGGFLEEVVRMAGLFIDKGPMVQVKGREGFAHVLDDREGGTIYDGPLAILVNNNSASASEILAAAMQDYKRGIIIGGNSTFGKGTVQNFANLDEVNPEFANVRPLGSLKLTIQKFYRISGGSTQLKGVIPDVILPDPYSEIERGEKDQDYPLKYDEIQPARYSEVNKVNKDVLKSKSRERTSKSQAFSLIEEQSKRIKSQRDKSEVNLNLAAFRAEQKKNKEEGKKYDFLNKEIPGFEALSLENEAGLNASDTSHFARNRESLKLIKKDNYIFESVKILEDMK
jgi:carboxyl-terminal processing protease